MHFVLDLVEFDSHDLHPVSLSCGGSIDFLFDEVFCHGVMVMLMLVGDLELLFDEKLHLRNLGLALGVVNMDSCLSSFLRSENVLVESAPHRRLALVDAAPGLDIRSFFLLIACLELNCWLSDHKDLLVLHLVVSFVVEKLSLDIVLDLSFWLVSVLLVGKVE